MISKAVRAFAFSLTLIGVHGMAVSQVAKPVAEGLMRKSGLWEQLGSIGPQMESGLGLAVAQSGQKMPPDELKRLGQAFAAAYSPMHLRSTALAVLTARLTPADVGALDAWYNSPEGKAVTKAEELSTANAGDTQARVQAGVKLLSTISAERQALLTQLAQVTRATEATVDIIINSAVAMQDGLVKATPKGPKASLKELRATLEQQRPQLTKSFDSVMVALFAAMYDGLDDAVIGQYVDFLNSSAGSAYTDASLRAVDRAFVEAGQALGGSMPAVKSNANL